MLVKERTRFRDGSEGEEIVPIEGDYCFPSYSTVEEAVRISERHGVPRESWPYYCDWYDDIPLDEVSRKCQLLRLHLGGMDNEAIALNWFLKRVAEWLSNGEVFYVGE
jgi:hypothetical protein